MVTTVLTAVVTVSIRSGSRTVKVPLVLRPALVSVSAAVALSPTSTVITGGSLTAAMVTVKTATPLVSSPSLTVTSKTRVLASVKVSEVLLYCRASTRAS